MAKKLTKQQIHQFYSLLQAENPEPQGELEHGNLYQLLVAVVLSAQATDKGVNKATKPLFEKVHTPQQMVALGLDQLTDYVKSIGLYRNKAKNVIALSEQLITNHDGEVPNDQKALEALPGVGRKTANVVRNIGFGEPTIAVDTHVFRVSNRAGLAPGKDVVAVEESLNKRTPKEFLLHAHHWLILHGRYVCVARTPKCQQCVVRDVCNFKDKIL